MQTITLKQKAHSMSKHPLMFQLYFCALQVLDFLQAETSVKAQHVCCAR